MVLRKRHLVRGSAAVTLFVATPAPAQLAATVGLDSDYRLRGYSLTNDHPALTGQLSYDHASGLYLDLSGVVDLGDDGRFLGVIANAGYARRVSDRATLDAGAVRYQIRGVATGAAGFKYTELYLGAYVGQVSGRVSYSPGYRSSGISTLYGEIEAHFDPSPQWRLSAHAGLLTYLNASPFHNAGSTHRDWRLSVARQFGKFEIHSALSGGSPSTYYGYRLHENLALTAGASISF